MKQILAVTILIFSISAFSQKVKTETTYKYEMKGQKEIKKKISEKTYDQKENKIKDISFTDNGEINKTKLYRFDDDNNLIEEKTLDKKGKTIKTITYKYENGHKIRKTVKDADGIIKSKKEYTYTFY
jgi:hypothetical protein